MAATLYFAAFTSANTPTWARADIANGRHGFSATGYTASNSTTTGVPTSGSGGDVSVGITLSGLTAGTAYKVWLVWDDGVTASGTPAGTPLGSAEFTTDQLLTAGLFTGTPAFYAGSISLWLTAGLFTGSPAFYAATVSPGAVTLTPSLFTGAPVFYAATVANASGTQGLTPTLFTGSPAFYAATVSAGAVSLTPGLFTGTSAFYAASVSKTVAPGLFTGTSEFYAPAVTVGAAPLTAGLFTGSPEFYGHTLTGGDVVVVARPTGAGKSTRKPRKRRLQVEIDGEVFDVDSPEEAEAVLANVAKEATETAKLAIERASKAKRRPVRKIVRDAEKALQIPDISVPEKLRSYADQVIGKIRAEYESAMSAIGIAAHMAKREREIEEDDEEVLMLI